MYEITLFLLCSQNYILKKRREEKKKSKLFKYNIYKFKQVMKRRKIIGLVLFIGTIVYLMASILALYQNQRVKMEKGMEEALKAYAKKDELNVKELSKDFNLLLEEKMDIRDMNQQILKYEGSFARMEKNVTNVTDEMAAVEYNISHLNERMHQVENYYNAFYEEVENRNAIYEEKMIEITNAITSVNHEMEEIKTEISEIKKLIEESNSKINADMTMLQERITECEERGKVIEENVLYYQFDRESQTLNVYGNERVE